jgi:transposase
VLPAADGLNNPQLARQLGVDADTARLWRMRCLELQGTSLDDLSVDERLCDAPNPGAAARITAEQVCQMVALACEAPEKAGRPISQWSAREIADEMMARGIVTPLGCSKGGSQTQTARRGRPPKEHRPIVNGMLWLLHTGAPWRDLPEPYGPWQTVATRFYRWRRAGICDRILAELQEGADANGKLDWSLHHIDGTIIRAHQHAAGAQKGDRPPELSRRGVGMEPGWLWDQDPQLR